MLSKSNMSARCTGLLMDSLARLKLHQGPGECFNMEWRGCEEAGQILYRGSGGSWEGEGGKGVGGVITGKVEEGADLGTVKPHMTLF